MTHDVAAYIAGVIFYLIFGAIVGLLCLDDLISDVTTTYEAEVALKVWTVPLWPLWVLAGLVWCIAALIRLVPKVLAGTVNLTEELFGWRWWRRCKCCTNGDSCDCESHCPKHRGELPKAKVHRG